MSQSFDIWLIPVAVLASISFLGSCYAVIVMSQVKLVNSSTKCVLYLHITNIIEVIGSLPYIYNTIPKLCKFMAFVHIYSDLSNVIVCGAITYYLHRILYSNDIMKEKDNKHLEMMIFAFPLITLLPFSTESYGSITYGTSENWCSLRQDHLGNIWSLAVLYAWVWMILLISISMFSLIFYRVFKTYSAIAPQLLIHVGIYPLITILSWVPRTILRIEYLAQSGLNSFLPLYDIPLYAAGIIYSLLFIAKQNTLIQYEKNCDQLSEHSDSWEHTVSVNSKNDGSAGAAMDKARLLSAEHVQDDYYHKINMKDRDTDDDGEEDVDDNRIVHNP